MSNYLNPNIFIKGFEKYNEYKYCFALSDDRLGTNLFMISDVFTEPFNIYEEEISISGFDGTCKKINDGKANYLLLIKFEDELPEDSFDVVFYSLLENEKNISENTEGFTVGNIRIDFEGTLC